MVAEPGRAQRESLRSLSAICAERAVVASSSAMGVTSGKSSFDRRGVHPSGCDRRHNVGCILHQVNPPEPSGEALPPGLGAWGSGTRHGQSGPCRCRIGNRGQQAAQGREAGVGRMRCRVGAMRRTVIRGRAMLREDVLRRVNPHGCRAVGVHVGVPGATCHTRARLRPWRAVCAAPHVPRRCGVGREAEHGGSGQIRLVPSGGRLGEGRREDAGPGVRRRPADRCCPVLSGDVRDRQRPPHTPWCPVPRCHRSPRPRPR